MEKRVLKLDASTGEAVLETVDEPGIVGVIDYAVTVHEREETWKKNPLEENVLVMGVGPLAGSVLPGTQRLILCARSPVVGTLFMSTMGGAGIPLAQAGIDILEIRGRAQKESVLVIKDYEAWLEEPPEFETVYDLQDALLERHRNTFPGDFRILSVGAAARNTVMGAVYSRYIRNKEFVEGSECWAGRGGFGSILAQCHNIVAIVYGGTGKNKRDLPELLLSRTDIDALLEREFGKKSGEWITQATTKYRYDQKVGSGGTFGVNMKTLGTWLPMLNWSSVNLPPESRERLYRELVEGHYLEQFQKETIETRNWTTCGEPCPAVCKKYARGHKKDYEAYESFGPQCGIFDQRHAEMAAEAIEGYGFDAIGFGNIASFLMEAMWRGWIEPRDLGWDGEPPNFDPGTISLEDSERHAKIARAIARSIALRENRMGELMAGGLRMGVRLLEKEYGHPFRDIANYVPFGDGDYYVVPCQYWVPGFYVPLPIQGKFYTYYGQDYKPPRELGRISAERSIKEMYSENTGLCRFHRGWTEKAIPLILNQAFGLGIDYHEHCKRIIQRMREYDEKAGACAVFWETKRVIEVIFNYVKEANRVFGATPESVEWEKKFDRDAWGTAREYWEEMREGVRTVLG